MSWMKRNALLAGWLAVLCVVSATANACGPTSDCVIGKRHYRILMPAGYEGRTRVGAIVYAHGYRGSARQVMRNRNLTKLSQQLGVALIAAKSHGRDWSIPGAPDSAWPDVDELAYFDRVIDDAARRFPIDTTKLMASGFSAGAMMVWNLACYRSNRFAGFAPISGTFWDPLPRHCTTPPASVIHMHGTFDKVVPLKGRRIANARQGDVIRAIEMYARFGDFGPPSNTVDGSLTCRRHVNAGNRLLEFCTFPGGHTFDAAYIARAWRLTGG